MNKNAQVGTTITMIVATLVVVLILAVFIWAVNRLIEFNTIVIAAEKIVTFKFLEQKGLPYESQQESVSIKAYLGTPVKINIDNQEQEIEISDLVRLSVIASSQQDYYKEKLKEKTEEIFSFFSKEKGLKAYCYILNIDSEQKSFEFGDRNNDDCELPAGGAIAHIPSNNQIITAKLRLTEI